MFLKIRLIVFFLFFGNGYLLHAQILKPGDTGKTFYDSAYSRVCEVFHYDLQYIFIEDTVSKTKTYKETIIIRNGPYLEYYPDGRIACSGYYVDNERDSTWLYYQPNGLVHKKETYKNDYLIE